MKKFICILIVSIFSAIVVKASLFAEFNQFYSNKIYGFDLNAGLNIIFQTDSSKIVNEIDRFGRSEFLKLGWHYENKEKVLNDINFNLFSIKTYINVNSSEFQRLEASVLSLKHSNQLETDAEALKLTLGVMKQISFEKLNKNFYGLYFGFTSGTIKIDDSIRTFSEKKFNGLGPVLGLEYFYQNNRFLLIASNEFKSLIWDKSLFIIQPEISIEYYLNDCSKLNDKDNSTFFKLKALYKGSGIYKYNSNEHDFNNTFAIGVICNY